VMIVNDDSSIIDKLETSLIDDARVIIYDCHMFILQATSCGGTVEEHSPHHPKVESLRLAESAAT
jgi:hypothetical protein